MQFRQGVLLGKQFKKNGHFESEDEGTEVRSGAVGSGTVLQAERLRVRFPMLSL
jgi:hypothetical protein